MRSGPEVFAHYQATRKLMMIRGEMIDNPIFRRFAVLNCPTKFIIREGPVVKKKPILKGRRPVYHY